MQRIFAALALTVSSTIASPQSSMQPTDLQGPLVSPLPNFDVVPPAIGPNVQPDFGSRAFQPLGQGGSSTTTGMPNSFAQDVEGSGLQGTGAVTITDFTDLPRLQVDPRFGLTLSDGSTVLTDVDLDGTAWTSFGLTEAEGEELSNLISRNLTLSAQEIARLEALLSKGLVVPSPPPPLPPSSNPRGIPIVVGAICPDGRELQLYCTEPQNRDLEECQCD